jgi:tetratricopeptide (TPR) repeat protein
MKTFGFILLGAWMVLMLSAPALAETKIVTATGKYVMGDRDSKNDAKKVALMNAKQMALEKAGTYISSLTEVKNYQLSKDEISSLTAGVVTIQEKDEKWTMEGESPVVTITIKAAVETENLQEKIRSLKEDREQVDSYKKMQEELVRLREELEALKKEKASVADTGEKANEKTALSEKQKNTINKMLALDEIKKAGQDIRAGRYQKAIETLNDVVVLDPDNHHAYMMLALAHGRSKNYDLALENVDKGISLNPNESKAHEGKGRILFEKGEYGQALESFTRALAINPDCHTCFFVRGNTYMKLRRFREAYFDFKAACDRGFKPGCHRVREMDKRRKRRLAQ